MKIILVDDHPVVRAGLVALLSEEEDLSVVGEAGTTAEAVKLTETTAPNVVLMDLQQAVCSGFRFLRGAPCAKTT